MTCGDPFTLPTAVPIINWLNQLKVGMSLADLLLGIAKIAVSIAIDAIFNKLGSAKGGAAAAKKAAKEAAEAAAKKSVGRQIAGAILPEVAGKLGVTPKAFFKKSVNALAGFGFSVVEGNPSYKIGIGGGPVPELALEVKQDNPNGDLFGVPGMGVGVGNTPTNDPLNIVTDPE